MLVLVSIEGSHLDVVKARGIGGHDPHVCLDIFVDFYDGVGVAIVREDLGVVFVILWQCLARIDVDQSLFGRATHFTSGGGLCRVVVDDRQNSESTIGRDAGHEQRLPRRRWARLRRRWRRRVVRKRR